MKTYILIEDEINRHGATFYLAGHVISPSPATGVYTLTDETRAALEKTHGVKFKAAKEAPAREKTEEEKLADARAQAHLEENRAAADQLSEDSQHVSVPTRKARRPRKS